jgi:hypothetical protein
VNTLPAKLQPVARELVESVKHKTAVRRQGQIA